MMKNSFFAVIVTCFVFIVIIPSIAKSDECSLRIKIAERWKNYAKNVADISKDPEAISAYKFIKKRAGTGLPEIDNNGEMTSTICEKNYKNYFFSIIPIIESDFEKWKKAGSGSSAFAHTGNRAIIVRDFSKKPDLIQGIMLIHETFHIALYLKRRMKENKGDDIFKEELKVHSLCNKIFEKVGGLLYWSALNNYTKKIDEFFQEDNDFRSIIKKIINSQEIIDKPMEKVFGKSLSMGDTKARRTQIIIHSYFNWVDQKFTDFQRREAEKIRFYKAISAHSDRKF